MRSESCIRAQQRQPCDSKDELALLKNIRERFDLDVLTGAGHTQRLSVSLSAVNNKCGRKKYIYYDKDRHQATQT